MKIQSISDLITNSSSEAFMIVDEDNMTRIKQAIGELLAAFGIHETVDNVFDIRPDYKQCKDIVKHLILTGYYNTDYSDDYGEIENEDEYYKIDGYPLCKKEADITDDMWEKASYELLNHIDDYPYINDFTITAKQPQYKEIAEAIDKLLHTPTYEAFYC